MFEKTLTDIVKGIRASKRDTALYISQCIAEIKTEINDSDMYVKANALQKLTFLQMMGYSMSWASFATIEVMSSPRFAHKRIGYLAASQGFTQDTDVILLTTNLLKKEMRGAIGGSMNGVYEAGLAVNCVSNIVTEELSQDLLPELTHLTQHPQPYLRKKAILCLFKVFVKYPQGLRLTFSQIQNCLNDQNSAVVSCAVNVITELSDKNPKNYLHLAPAFFDLLTTSSNNWMLIKVVKLLGSLVPEEPRLARKLLEPLADIVRNTPAKSLLYEAVHAITLCLPYCRKSDGTMPASVPDIVALCASTLKEFVEEKDQNLKYLGLVGFGSLIQSHPKVLSAPNYRPLILACLSDEDVTIRTRALGLLPGMASRKNVVELVTQLLQHVELASGDYKLELVRVIVEMCSGEKYALLPDFAWYLDTLFKLGHMRGLDTHAELLRQQVADVALRVLPVRAYAVKRSVEILLEGEQINISQDIDSDNGRGKHVIPEILPALAWIVGEYAALIPEVLNMDPDAVYIYNTESEGPYHSIVQVLSAPPCQAKLPPTTQKVYIQAGMKVFAAACGNHQVSNVELEACSRSLCTHLPVYMQSIDAEVQQRAFSAYALLDSLGVASTGVFGTVPGLASIEDGDDSDERKSTEGDLLVATDIIDLASAAIPNMMSTGKSESLASRCREASETLNFLLKPSPMKPNGAKAQRKKYQTPVGVDDQINVTVNISVFSTVMEQERAGRVGSRLTMESVTFTQQRPLHVAETSAPRIGPVMDAVSSEDLPLAGTITNGTNGDRTNVSMTGGRQTAHVLANSTLDRPQTASDPFYLSAAPAIPNGEENGNIRSRFGMIQLGEGESEDDEAAGGKGKPKKKKKDKKKKSTDNEMNHGALFGGNVSSTLNYGPARHLTVYTSDDDDDDSPIAARNLRRSRPGKEFQGLANVDLTMPLREDEVMPERRHRVVPQHASHRFRDTPDSTPVPKASKLKKKNKKSKKTSGGDFQVQLGSQGQGDGDLLDLAFSPSDATFSPQPVLSSSIFQQSHTAHAAAGMGASHNQGDTISSAFDDLLGLSGNVSIPLLPAAAPAITAGHAANISSGFATSATVQPEGVLMPTKLSKYPWIRGSIKSSKASGPPAMDWSKIQLFSQVCKASGNGLITAWINVRIQNYMGMGSHSIDSLDVEGFGNVPIAVVAPGSQAEYSQVGPFSYSSIDTPLEVKGVLQASDCRVPIRFYLPVSVYFAPTKGLALEDVAEEVASPHWSSVSTKLPISSGANIKTQLASFLRLAEVQPDLSGPANGSFAGQSKASGARIRLLAKVRKDKLKIDLKTSNSQIGEAIISDLKHLVF